MSDRVRVLTANLWNGVADPAGFAELVERLAVDVVCTQEMSPEQAEALVRVLPHGHLEPRRDHNGMGIALRRPADLRRVRLPKRDAHVAELDPGAWPGLAAPLEILSVHIVGPHVWPPQRSWPTRRGQLRGLTAYLDAAERRARVLVGDFNATRGFPVYQRLLRRLDDGHARAAHRRGRRPGATWGPTPRAPRILRIDHALTESVHVDDARVVPIPGSDHSALLVDLSPED
jgi:endonuclease/exonuclease/phosphatase (EEP) superfamily protein YafD